MSNLLKDILIDPFTDDGIGILLGITMWILFIVIFGFMLYGILFIVDYSFRHVNEGYGIIVDKEFIPEHDETTMIYNAALKMSVPHTTHYDDQYKLSIQVDDLIDKVLVNSDYYYNMKIGKRIKVKYSHGRIWKSLYIKEIF